MTSCMISKSHSSGTAVSVGNADWLLPAMARETPSGTDVCLGDSSAPANSCCGSWPVFLASYCRQWVSTAKVNVRSDSMFQCLQEGGPRSIATLGPCHMFGGTSLVPAPAGVQWYPLRGEGKQPDERAPLQVAGSTPYGA